MELSDSFVLHVVRGARMLPSFNIAELGRSRRYSMQQPERQNQPLKPLDYGSRLPALCPLPPSEYSSAGTSSMLAVEWVHNHIDLANGWHAQPNNMMNGNNKYKSKGTTSCLAMNSSPAKSRREPSSPMLYALRKQDIGIPSTRECQV